jgi:hypothetical protein
VVWLSNVCKIEKNGKIIGVVVKAKTEKSKTPRPFRDCTFSIYFDYGVDNIGSSLDYLFDLRTDKGKLIDNKKICWGEGSLAQTMENVNAWLKEIDLYDKLKEIKKEETGRANLSVEWVKEHVEKDTKLTELFNNKFGEPLERQALIELIEQSPELQKELEQRVIAKWEAEETAIATNRKKKYV